MSVLQISARKTNSQKLVNNNTSPPSTVHCCFLGRESTHHLLQTEGQLQIFAQKEWPRCTEAHTVFTVLISPRASCPIFWNINGFLQHSSENKATDGFLCSFKWQMKSVPFLLFWLKGSEPAHTQALIMCNTSRVSISPGTAPNRNSRNTELGMETHGSRKTSQILLEGLYVFSDLS